jgi:hypothetical protein
MYSILFHTLNWEKDIKPWKIPSCYAYYPDQIRREATEDKPRQFFNVTSSALSSAGYAHLVSDFLLYAIPIVEEMSRKLATLVSPETYTELLRLYHGEKL